MTLLGLDYAGGRPGGRAITAAGYQFVVRYLSDGGPGLPGKLLTLAEYQDLQAHGIRVVANWETLADRMRAGYGAGVADAQRADGQVRAVGHPTDRPVYFSADWDATPAEQAEIDDYLRGCASVIGPDRVGVYGGYWVVSRCLDNDTARWAWQTGAWSGGQREQRAHMYQRIGYATVGGIQCDVNEALQPDYGQHPVGDVPPVPDPVIGPSVIPFMNYGDTSDAVRRLQVFLNRVYPAYSHLPVTGYYGDMTRSVIREFQRRVGIVGADGRNVGVLTKARLFEAGFRG